MPEERKLKMLKYNKTLQSYLNIGIINYMHFKNKYIVYDTKGIGKEYDYYSGKLIYEGEYLHGERNGKGKEQTDNGKPRFEGEYLNGKEITGIKYAYNGNSNKQSKQVNGIGKEYEYNTGSLEYEGGYLNYERNGKGREYCLDFKLRFEGEYLNGKKWSGKGYYYTISRGYSEIYELKDGKGYIKEYNFDRNLIYEGEYLNGERNGKGKEYCLEGHGLLFEGEFLEGKRWTGKGYDDNLNVVLELNNGKGKGKEFSRFSNILLYDGEFLNGKYNGKGKYYNRYGGLFFEGEFSNGKRIGKGKEYHNFADMPLILAYEGEFLNDKKSGKGKEYDYEGKFIKYEGEYLNDKKHGKGKEYENNELIFEGEFRNDSRWNGKGKILKEINETLILKFEGEYLNGKINGKGKKYFDNGKIYFEGEYLNGKMWNGKGYNKNGDYDFEIKNGKGIVKLYDDSYENLSYEGEYLNGEKNGKGKEYDIEGNLKFEGEFINGKQKESYIDDDLELDEKNSKEYEKKKGAKKYV